MTELSCSWCAKPVAPDDGYRLYEPSAERLAAFCRLEHIVPWAIRGPTWATEEAPVVEGDCVQCGKPAELVLVRHRGEHRIPDAFCTVEHVAEWAKSGGRWR